MKQLIRDFTNGIWGENPTFRMVIGVCSALAVTTSATNGLAMGIALTFVLTCSCVLISLLRNVIPAEVRIPCYVIVIATFTTVVDLFLKAYFPQIYAVLGIFIPLIVVNCIILGRAEAFASKNTVWLSIADALGMGLGFTLALVVVAGVREVLGNATFWGVPVPGLEPVLLMILPPGGFMVLGSLLGFMNHVQAGIARRQGKTFVPPAHLDCRHCLLCDLAGKKS